MKSEFRLHPSSLILLSHLWLHEPDVETIVRANDELSLPPAAPEELAPAYLDVFLLNVPPYGTAFTDSFGELNGPEAQHVASLYDAHGYHPAELQAVGAPDHVGLCLGFLAYLEERGLVISEFPSAWLAWIPVCCLAVEREPSAHPFYRSLATKTRAFLFSQCETSSTLVSDYHLPITDHAGDDELTLRYLVRFFLTPARCGMFLSRSRWGHTANALGMRLPFGSRFDVAEIVFRIAGDSQRVTELLQALSEELEQWAAAYRAWSTGYPAWQAFAVRWLRRIDSARQTLAGMREILERPLELEPEVHDVAQR